MKVLLKQRDWFPDARIVGWKYELAGSRDDAFSNAWKQLHVCQTDARVLNGAAYGERFAICHTDERVETCAETPELCTRFKDGLQGESPVIAPVRNFA